MSHHSDEPISNAKLAKLFNISYDPTMEERLMGQEAVVGLTDKYPNGRIDPLDKGELEMAMGVHQGVLVLDFGTAVKWCAFTKEQALDLAKIITKQAETIDDASDKKETKEKTTGPRKK